MADGLMCYYYVFNTLLFFLLVINIYWWWLLCGMLVRQVRARGQISDDVRSGKDHLSNNVFFVGFTSITKRCA